MVLLDEFMPAVIDNTARTDIFLARFTEKPQRLFMLIAEGQFFLDLSMFASNFSCNKIF
jgi:hypothetical protein